MARSKLREKAIPILLGFGIVLCSLWLRITTTEPFAAWLTKLDHYAYDIQFNLIPEIPAGKDSEIIILDIDEKSLAKYGSWPWPRDVVSQMVDNLFNAGAIVVAFDVVFPNSEGNIAQQLLDRLPPEKREKEFITKVTELLPQYDTDTKLVESVAKGDTVLGVIFHNRSTSQEGVLPGPAMILDDNLSQGLTIPVMEGFTGNNKSLQESAKHGGFITAIPDSDGVIRRSPLLIRNGNRLYLSLALEACRLYLLVDDVALNIQEIGEYKVIEGIKLGQKSIPTDEYGQVMVPFRGGAGSYPYVSAAEVIENKMDPRTVENKIVFVGTTALGMGDMRAVPPQSVYPGIEVHANIADGILKRGFPVKPSWAIGAEFLMIVFIGGFCALIFPFLGPKFLTASALFFPAVLIVANAWLWSREGLILSFVIPMIMVDIIAMTNMGYGYLFENRAKRLIKWMFGQYVPMAHVEQMTLNPDEYGMSGENREMTILFADIRNFTSIAESLEANALKNLLNQFFTPMTELIFNHEGTIDKYVGDMIMAFWGAPLRDEAHAKHAIQAAMAMIEKVTQLKAKFIEMGLPEIDIGVGINTGIVSVGDMGSEYRRAYTVIGDSVNLASRLEGLTKYYGVSIIVGPQTHDDNPDYVFRLIDKVRVKGKLNAVEIYQPLCSLLAFSNEKRTEVEAYHGALKLYHTRDFKKAAKEFKMLINQYPYDKLYQVYLNRCKQLRDNPPDKKWDGVFISTTK